METVNEILATLLPHWPFVAVMAIFGLVGVVMNKRVFTEAEAKKKRRVQWLFWWGRKTLPLHPVLSGLALGLIWKMPEPGVDLAVERAAYFGLAGACSVFAYEVIKGLAKKRGIEIELPGGSTPPAAKPADETTPTDPTTPA